MCIPEKIRDWLDSLSVDQLKEFYEGFQKIRSSSDQEVQDEG